MNFTHCIFIIPGYGVPKNILRDENYSFYLKMAFNVMYDRVIKQKPKHIHIIFTGGKTDCFNPYRRTEAGEMMRFFKTYFESKPYLKEILHSISFHTEKTALSTLENFLYCRKLLKEMGLTGAIHIVCEKTRERRIRILARRVFQTKNVSVFPIDFDMSANRYSDPQFISEKEKKTLSLDLWALKSPINLKKHHNLFREKIARLRKAGARNHVEAIHQWWEQMLLKELF